MKFDQPPQVKIESSDIAWDQGEKSNFLYTLRSESDFRQKLLITWKANEKGISQEELLREIKEYAKTKISSIEKVNYFHTTSLSRFESIAKMGRLLSRSELKKINPEIELPGWSSSDNVMMTKDTYSLEGKIVSPGLSSHGVGASGGGVVLVLSPEITKLENFNAIGMYPTVSDAPLDKVCTVVLVETETDVPVVAKILVESKLSLPVELRRDWVDKHYKEENLPN